MDFVSKIKAERLRDEMNAQLNFDYSEFTDLLSRHDDFINSGFTEISLAITQKEQPSANAINKLMDLSLRADKLEAAVRGTYSKGHVLQVAEYILSLKEFYDYLMTAYMLFGISEKKGFEIKQNYISYTISKGESLQQIAERFLGSRERVVDILEANTWLYLLKPSEMYLKEIKIPARAPKLAAFSSNYGKASWGTDLPDELTVDAEGDLALLDFEETLKQGVMNILNYPLKSVPEDVTLGNPLIKAVGAEWEGINIAVSLDLLRSALLNDPTVESMEVADIYRSQDALVTKIVITPINSEQGLEVII